MIIIVNVGLIGKMMMSANDDIPLFHSIVMLLHAGCNKKIYVYMSVWTIR
jgi:hypothetical protein